MLAYKIELAQMSLRTIQVLRLLHFANQPLSQLLAELEQQTRERLRQMRGVAAQERDKEFRGNPG